MEHLPQPAKPTQEQIEALKQEFLRKARQKVAYVNASHHAMQEARDAADAKMSEKTGFWNRIIKQQLFHEFFRQREINKAHKEIEKNQNIYIRERDTTIAHDGAMQDIAERFISEYEEALTKHEKRETLKTDNPEGARTKNDLRNLILEYATADQEMDKASFNEAKKRILGGVTHELVKDAKTYADNVFEIAKNARLAIQYGAKLEELDLDLEIIVGNARSSIKTEAKLSGVDKFVEKYSKTWVGRLVSPATLSMATGLVYSFTKYGGQRLARTAGSVVAPLVGAAAISGVFAGIHESKRLKEERAQDAREIAKGGTVSGKRREMMAKYHYETITAQDAIKGLESKILVGGAEKTTFTKGEYESALIELSKLEARVALGNEKDIDLITYTSLEHVEKENTQILILIGRAKRALKNFSETAEGKQYLTKGDFKSELQSKEKFETDTLMGGEKGITKQDKKFLWFKRKQSFKKGLVTAGIGLVIGTGVQEARGWIDVDGHAWGKHTKAMFEGREDSQKMRTPLEWLRHTVWKDEVTHEDVGGGSTLLEHGTEKIEVEGHTLKVPEGTTFVKNGDLYDVIKDGDTVLKSIPVHFEADGGMDGATQKIFADHGILVSEDNYPITSENIVETKPADYIKAHGDKFTKVDRDMWYDNNTPKPFFDKDELKLWFGGAGNKGLTPNGDYVFNVAHMFKGGSFHDQFSVDAQEKIKNGGLEVLLSMTKGTQSHVLKAIVDTHGDAVFDHTDPEVQAFFSTDTHGHAVFHGRYAEAAETFGVDKAGDEHVKLLATYEGKGINSVLDSQVTVDTQTMTTIDIPQVADPVVEYPLGLEKPLFLPVPSRRPLERVTYHKKNLPDNARLPVAPAPIEGGVAGAPVRVENAKEKYDFDLHPGTDYVRGIMGSKEVNYDVLAKMYTEKYDHPAFIIFETDPKKREDTIAKIKEVKKKYPSLQVVYIPFNKDMVTKKHPETIVPPREYVAKMLRNIRDDFGLPEKTVIGIEAPQRVEVPEGYDENGKRIMTREMLAEENELAMEYLGIVAKDSDLMKKWKIQYENYFILKNYHNLKTKAEKDKVDALYNQDVANSGEKSINQFLRKYIEAMNEIFAAEMRKIKPAGKKKALATPAAPTVVAAAATPATVEAATLEEDENEVEAEEDAEKFGDLLVPGATFENKYFKFKVIEPNAQGKARVEKTDKESGKMKVEMLSGKKIKELESEYSDGELTFAEAVTETESEEPEPVWDSVITEKEYDIFVDKGTASPRMLKVISRKMMKSETLTVEEEAVRMAHNKEIDKLLQASTATKTKTPEKKAVAVNPVPVKSAPEKSAGLPWMKKLESLYKPDEIERLKKASPFFLNRVKEIEDTRNKSLEKIGSEPVPDFSDLIKLNPEKELEFIHKANKRTWERLEEYLKRNIPGVREIEGMVELSNGVSIDVTFDSGFTAADMVIPLFKITKKGLEYDPSSDLRTIAKEPLNDRYDWDLKELVDEVKNGGNNGKTKTASTPAPSPTPIPEKIIPVFTPEINRVPKDGDVLTDGVTKFTIKGAPDSKGNIIYKHDLFGGAEGKWKPKEFADRIAEGKLQYGEEFKTVGQNTPVKVVAAPELKKNEPTKAKITSVEAKTNPLKELAEIKKNPEEYKKLEKVAALIRENFNAAMEAYDVTDNESLVNEGWIQQGIAWAKSKSELPKSKISNPLTFENKDDGTLQEIQNIADLEFGKIMYARLRDMKKDEKTWQLAEDNMKKHKDSYNVIMRKINKGVKSRLNPDDLIELGRYLRINRKVKRITL